MFDQLADLIKGKIHALMISESKIDYSFPTVTFSLMHIVLRISLIEMEMERV